MRAGDGRSQRRWTRAALHDQVTNLTALVALELVQCSWETDGRSTVRSVGR
ncbi:hypothetical protein N806_24625 [Rhodococcus sp. P27]|nr:hypothetical protein N806_24625 [Rhodococcus sp. P27]